MLGADKGQEQALNGSRLRIGIVQARFNEGVTGALHAACLAELTALGVRPENITHLTVPGALEVPSTLQWLARRGKVDALVALGCIIRGETYHFEVVAGESARAIMALTLDGLAIGNGILTVENEAQAWARARRSEKDKGGEAAKAALAMIAVKHRFQ